eukprot:4682527-Pyramimonas_sp.AAC.1
MLIGCLEDLVLGRIGLQILLPRGAVLAAVSRLRELRRHFLEPLVALGEGTQYVLNAGRVAGPHRCCESRHQTIHTSLGMIHFDGALVKDAAEVVHGLLGPCHG